MDTCQKVVVLLVLIFGVRVCLKFISSWKSIVCGSDKEKISAFSELNKLIFSKSGSENVGFQPIEI